MSFYIYISMIIYIHIYIALNDIRIDFVSFRPDARQSFRPDARQSLLSTDWVVVFLLEATVFAQAIS